MGKAMDGLKNLVEDSVQDAKLKWKLVTFRGTKRAARSLFAPPTSG